MARKIEKKICTCCGKELQLKEFYKSSSELYTDGKLPICKECFNERFSKLLNLYDGKINDAWKHLCYNLDMFYDEQLYLSCCGKDNFVGEYMRLLATKDRRDKTSLNNSVHDNREMNEIALDDGIITEEIVDFWGEGFSAKEYMRLERKYKKYTKHDPSESLQEQEIIKNLCELEIMRENCRRNGKTSEYDKVTTQIRKSMDDLNVLPSKMQKYGEDDDVVPGVLIYKIERHEPIPDKHEEFNDVDKIKWLVDRYLARPLRLFFGMEQGDLTYEDVKDEKYEKHKD